MEAHRYLLSTTAPRVLVGSTVLHSGHTANWVALHDLIRTVRGRQPFVSVKGEERTPSHTVAPCTVIDYLRSI